MSLWHMPQKCTSTKTSSSLIAGGLNSISSSLTPCAGEEGGRARAEEVRFGWREGGGEARETPRPQH
jgi:hypothetical protein